MYAPERDGCRLLVAAETTSGIHQISREDVPSRFLLKRESLPEMTKNDIAAC